jgi:pilus assembly protein Flp/PilA
MKNLLQHWQRDTSGQALTEYALILAVVAVAVVAVMTLLGDQIVAVFNGVLTSLGGTISTP